MTALDPRPAILTWRSAREGGHFAGSAEEYRGRVTEAYGSGAIVDVELATGLAADEIALPDRARVLVSAHFPFGLPPEWRDILARMRGIRAVAVKLVAGVAHVQESLDLAAAARAEADGRTAIFPMGPASLPGRILAAIGGSALVYGSAGAATAAGQPPLTELTSTYEAHRSRRIEALFGIVAQETTGSLSPLVHNALFRARELPNLYLPIPVTDFGRDDPSGLESDPPFRGFSVTRPWKLDAARTGVPGEDARAAGAANTLVREGERWRAENTDVDGIFEPLADHDTGEGRSAVVLGAGGTARAAVVAARRLGYEVLIASRRDLEADAVASELGVDSLAWDDVGASEADLYVNATPVGWRDEDPPAVPERALEHRPLVFDCVYRRDGRETSTVRAARAARCTTVEGTEMFAVQAAAQARYFGVEDATRDEVLSLLQRGT